MFPQQEHLPSTGGTRVLIPSQSHATDRWIRAERYSLETALQQAIVAGIDILVFANNNPRTYEPYIAPKAINIIAGLVEDGTISPARIDESVRRIEALKKRLSR
ncbi:MAG TPA: hypothetical protein VF734_10005 [Pseudonocardiaceae bacterium]